MDRNRLSEKSTISVPLIVGQTSEVGSAVSQHHYRWETKMRACRGSHRHCTVEVKFEPRSASLRNIFLGIGMTLSYEIVLFSSIGSWFLVGHFLFSTLE